MITRTSKRSKKARASASDTIRTTVARGAKITGVLTWKLASRVALGAGLGLLLGAIQFFLFGLGPWSDRSLGTLPISYWLIGPSYVILGTLLLGYAGLWRGVAHSARYVGVDRGLIAWLVKATIDRTAKKLADRLPDARTDNLLENRSRGELRRLLLDSTRESLEEAEATAGSSRLARARRWILRRANELIHRELENWLDRLNTLNRALRNDEAARGRMVQAAERHFTSAVAAATGKQQLLATLLYALACIGLGTALG